MFRVSTQSIIHAGSADLLAAAVGDTDKHRNLCTAQVIVALHATVSETGESLLQALIRPPGEDADGADEADGAADIDEVGGDGAPRPSQIRTRINISVAMGDGDPVIVKRASQAVAIVNPVLAESDGSARTLAMIRHHALVMAFAESEYAAVIPPHTVWASIHDACVRAGKPLRDAVVLWTRWLADRDPFGRPNARAFVKHLGSEWDVDVKPKKKAAAAKTAKTAKTEEGDEGEEDGGEGEGDGEAGGSRGARSARAGGAKGDDDDLRMDVDEVFPDPMDARVNDLIRDRLTAKTLSDMGVSTLKDIIQKLDDGSLRVYDAEELDEEAEEEDA